MNKLISNSMKSMDPLFLIDVLKKIVENCMDLRKNMKDLNCFKGSEVTKQAGNEAKDFLLIIDQLEYEIQAYKKVIYQFLRILRILRIL